MERIPNVESVRVEGDAVVLTSLQKRLASDAYEGTDRLQRSVGERVVVWLTDSTYELTLLQTRDGTAVFATCHHTMSPIAPVLTHRNYDIVAVREYDDASPESEVDAQ